MNLDNIEEWTESELRGALLGFSLRMDKAPDAETYFTIQRKYNRVACELLCRRCENRDALGERRPKR